jgi:hypothetical protein
MNIVPCHKDQIQQWENIIFAFQKKQIAPCYTTTLKANKVIQQMQIKNETNKSQPCIIKVSYMMDHNFN